jgi:hypothetical protein
VSQADFIVYGENKSCTNSCILYQQFTPIDTYSKPQAKIKSHVSIKIAFIRPELGMSAQGAKET